MGETNWIDLVVDNLSKVTALSDKIYDASYIKDECDPEKKLASVLPVIVECVNILGEFQHAWNLSAFKGDKAVISFKEGTIDTKLVKSKKVDFKLLEKVMERRLLCTSLIRCLDFIDEKGETYYISCKNVDYKLGVEKAEIFRKMVQLQKGIIESEREELKTQLENVDLYHQHTNLSKTLRIASLSLVFSALAVLVAVFKP